MRDNAVMLHRALPLLLALSCFAAARPALTPPPRHIEWTGGALALPAAVRAESPEEKQAARLLAAEAARLHRVDLGAADAGRPAIVLALADSARGREILARSPQARLFRESAGDETYLLETTSRGAAIVARRPRGLLFGVQTLLQTFGRGASGKLEAPGVRIVDYPQLGFRGVHICIFPNTELASVRQAMLTAARFKYNAVVLEPWASFRSPKHPETAYESAYTAAQLKPLIDLGRALGLETIPMLNSWGHASGMRSRAARHVVLDRFPAFRPLYEEDGWSFCLTNPDIYPHLFDRYAELMELFGNPRYFHIGLDEAWGHLGLMESNACRGADPRATLAAHLAKLYRYFADRKVRLIVWHDMFIERNHPTLGRLSPANSVPPLNTHLVLEKLPKDVVIDAWNYDQTAEWPVPKYFQDRGYPVLVSPWKSRKNTVMLLNAAKRIGAMGLLETTWDSLDVSLPTVGEAGVLAWTAPGFALDQVPFGELLRPLRALPITNLPALETTLSGR